MNNKRIILSTLIMSIVISNLTGCASSQNEVNVLNGSIIDNIHTASFYSNTGEQFMTAHGQKIDINKNIVNEKQYINGIWKYTKTLSSVITITIDGKSMESCGSTIIFTEDGLNPEVDFINSDTIDSTRDGSFVDDVFIANIVNHYKNLFGKSRVVIIQSQLGNPICAFSGDDVYWEVCQDLPKTTKLMIDGKALYIHRANFQIIDKDLLEYIYERFNESSK